MSIKETLNPPREHIIEARDMAHSIYKKPSEKHLEMLREIQGWLSKLHEEEVKRIKEL